MRRQTHRLARSRAIDAFHLEQDPSGTHARDPSFGAPFAFAHAGFGRLLGEGLIRKDANPDAAAALDMTRQRDTGGFERARIDPRGLDTLQSEVAESEFDVRAIRRRARGPS